jgi:hypothetical protein
MTLQPPGTGFRGCPWWRFQFQSQFHYSCASPVVLHSYTSTHSLTSSSLPTLLLSSIRRSFLSFSNCSSVDDNSIVSFCISAKAACQRARHSFIKLLNLESCLHQARVIRFVTVYCFNDLVHSLHTNNITAARSLAFARWLLALSSLVLLDLTVPSICFAASRDPSTKTISDSFDYCINIGDDNTRRMPAVSRHCQSHYSLMVMTVVLGV